GSTSTRRRPRRGRWRRVRAKPAQPGREEDGGIRGQVGKSEAPEKVQGGPRQYGAHRAQDSDGIESRGVKLEASHREYNISGPGRGARVFDGLDRPTITERTELGVANSRQDRQRRVTARVVQRRAATSAHTASTRPKGHAPCRKP